jgi:quinol monooxygenase YgiN
MSEAVFIVTIKLKPGASRDRFLELCRGTRAWLERQPGFVSYALFDGGDGRWTDVMTWASTEAMEAANQALSEHSGGFEDLVEPEYVSFTGEAAAL